MGGGSSKSSSSSTTNTTNIDRRQIVAEGGLGIASDGATVNVTTLDAGIVTSALDAVKANDATNGQSFSQLLSLADKLFTGAGETISKSQDTAIKQIDQIQTAANDQKGAVDQKTLIIMAGAALGLMALRKK